MYSVISGLHIPWKSYSKAWLAIIVWKWTCHT